MYPALKGIGDSFFPLQMPQRTGYILCSYWTMFLGCNPRTLGFSPPCGSCAGVSPCPQVILHLQRWEMELRAEKTEQLLSFPSPEALELPPVPSLGTASCSPWGAFCSHFSGKCGIACGLEHFRTQHMTSCFASAEGCGCGPSPPGFGSCQYHSHLMSHFFFCPAWSQLQNLCYVAESTASDYLCLSSVALVKPLQCSFWSLEGLVG